jgi:DNA-binding NarL/FixJ family response regulator
MLLVERDAELSRLAAALDAARAGRGGTLIVEGPPGVGKSGLLRAAQDSAAAAGMGVLSARGGELEQAFPHGVSRQLVERHIRTAEPAERARLLAGPAMVAARVLGIEGSAAPGEEGDFALLHGLYWLVANAAYQQPLVVCVDDAHWADTPSLRFLQYLARRLDGLPVLLVVATRPPLPARDRDPLAALVADPDASVLMPRPLSAAGTHALLDDVLGTADPAFAQACHHATQGNPLLLRQLCDEVRTEGLPSDAAGAARVAELGPRTVARSVRLRLGQLGSAAEQLARAVAVLGLDATLAEAAAVAELEPDEAARAADGLRAAQVLAEGPALEFAHPIVRSAIYAGIASGERSLAHARAANVLEEAGAAPSRIAPHLLQTAPAAQPRVVATLRRAAMEALRDGAAAIAVQCLERALSEPPAERERGDVLTELGAAELRTGEPERAARHLSEAVDVAGDPLNRARRRSHHARALVGARGTDAAVEELERAIEEAEPLDAELALRLEVERASIGLLREHVARFGGRLERYAGVEGRTPAERLVLVALARHRCLAGRPVKEAAALARRALADGHFLGEEGSDAVSVCHAARVLMVAGEFEEADSFLEAALADARRRGSSVDFGLTSGVRALLALRTDDVEGAEAAARAAIPALSEHAGWLPLPLSVLVEALVERGDLAGAEEALARHGIERTPPAQVEATRLLVARAALRLAQGLVADALADLDEVATRDERWQMRDPEPPWRLVAATAQLRAGRRDAAEALAAQQLALARTWESAIAEAEALRVLGLITDDPERLEAAIELLLDSGAALELARAHVELGAALRRAGRRSDAREPLRTGLDLARRCGAEVLASRAHEELIAAGARPRQKMFSGVEALTASERRVARMAASGLGNREIAQNLVVTVKTVENHLARVYAKLGIHSRTELADALEAAAGSTLAGA